MKIARTSNTDVAIDLEEEEQRQGYSLRQKLGLVSGIFLFVLVLWLPTPTELNFSAQRAGAVALLMAA